VVPFPVADAQSGCQLEVRLALPDAKAVLIYINGLPANAEVPLQLTSAGELEARKFSVNAQGHAVTTELPYVDGTNEGSLKVTLATEGCSANVEIPWGNGTSSPI
jgi:hypothetical protein